MKNLLFISLLLCSLNSKEQTDSIDFNHVLSTGNLVSTDSVPYIYFATNNGWHHEIEVGKLDTVPCMILATDTCLCYSGQQGFDISKGLRQEGFVYYLKGYQVNIGTSDQYNEYHYWKFVAYLDADKKPLSKNIIVWMSKAIQ